MSRLPDPNQLAPQRDPSIPNLSIEQGVAFCRNDLGLEFVGFRTIKTALYNRKLRRHLIANRVRLSENDIRAWIASTADTEYVPRHVPGGAERQSAQSARSAQRTDIRSGPRVMCEESA